MTVRFAKLTQNGKGKYIPQPVSFKSATVGLCLLAANSDVLVEGASNVPTEYLTSLYAQEFTMASSVFEAFYRPASALLDGCETELFILSEQDDSQRNHLLIRNLSSTDEPGNMYKDFPYLGILKQALHKQKKDMYFPAYTYEAYFNGSEGEPYEKQWKYSIDDHPFFRVLSQKHSSSAASKVKELVQTLTYAVYRAVLAAPKVSGAPFSKDFGYHSCESQLEAWVKVMEPWFLMQTQLTKLNKNR